MRKKLSDVDVAPYLPGDDIVRSDILDYALEIEWFDNHLGRMLKKLEEIGELDNTIVIVTSDNGMPFPRVKGHIFEDACHLPLAIRWTLMRASGAAEAVHRAEQLRGLADREEGQLLEFVFRRVFDGMTEVEKSVMQALSIFTEPSPIETLVAGTGSDAHAVVDALEDLARDALVNRIFDAARNDYIFGLGPLTRSFVLTDLRKNRSAEERIRHRLTGWYEALDVKNGDDRAVVREIRQGRESTENSLIDLARVADQSVCPGPYERRRFADCL